MKQNAQKYATARKLRNAGWSYGEISKYLIVSKSNLNNWLKDINLSSQQQQVLKKKWENGLKKARVMAAATHRQKTKDRFALAIKNAEKTIAILGATFYTDHAIKLFLAALYLGEGAKTKSLVCLANSNGDICKAFLTALRKVYKLDENKFRCHLHLRTDQKPQALIKYWSNLLQIPARQFLKTQIDKRTAGQPSHKDYFGVCAIYYYDASIQKDLLSLGSVMIKKLLTMGG